MLEVKYQGSMLGSSNPSFVGFLEKLLTRNSPADFCRETPAFVADRQSASVA